MKRILTVLALLAMTSEASYAQTAGQSVMGFLLAQGSTYNGFTCPASATLPCFVQYGSSVPTGGTASVTPIGATGTDISGTVTLGGTYQTVAAASGTRKNCIIQNPATATEVLNVKFGTMASPFTLNPGDSITALDGIVVNQDAITLTAATTSHAFSGICE